MPLTFASSELVAISLESVLYGTYAVLLFLRRFARSGAHSFPRDGRAVLFPLCVVRQGSLQQATAKGWGELPPHPGLDHSLRPHNLGSYPALCLIIRAPFIPLQHLVIDIVRLYLAFEKSETDQGADLYYVRVTAPLSVVKTAIYLAETVVSDLFIVRLSNSLSLNVRCNRAGPRFQLYRCYVVWNASVPIIVLPILLYLADIGMPLLSSPTQTYTQHLL
jgi:hypothetical protein